MDFRRRDRRTPPGNRLAFAALCAVLSVSAFTSPSLAEKPFPPKLVRFHPIDSNPVFQAGGKDRWDRRIRERGWILREGKTWKMWYTGYDGTRDGKRMLGYATSRDGLRWKRHPKNPVYRDHWVEDVMVVKRGGVYYLFAEGKGDIAHLLTSPDGVQWKRIGPLDIRRTNGKPISKGPRGTPTAWFEDGRWYLFYERYDKGIWLAVSKDLRVWKNLSDQPVLKPGPGKYDKQMIALNQIIKHDGRYYAYFHGSGTPTKPRLWTTNVAVSKDLVHWKKYPGNPLLPEKWNRSSGILVHDGKRYRLYTMHDRVDVYFPAESSKSTK